MIHLTASDCYDDFADELHAMHRLRFRIFKKRLDWDVRVNSGHEIDSCGALKPHYLLLRGFEGCVRLFSGAVGG
ncbi:acyl-homoserine-lactone synthase [Mesorhizobium sp. M0913]|uniref:acyl-homoserine-lactone synthase n=1 Tax=Mesorhizobium sp. M0913 TaxID=2957026 RepID=UPI0033385B47